MMLAHEWVKNQEYLNYFKKRQEEGKFVLMDNGAFENERVIWQELVDLTAQVRPSCVIMPDVLGNGIETRKDTLEFYNNHSNQIKELGVDLMAVPQGSTFEEFLENYKLFSSLEGVNYLWISYILFFNDIPGHEEELKRLEQEECQTRYRMIKRTLLINYLEENNIIDRSKRHHLLWLSDPFEYHIYGELLQDPSFIYSGDSALAYIMGKAGRIIDCEIGIVWDREKSLADFNEQPELNETQIRSIIRNIDVINRFASLVKE